jgi:hypothetical protein
MSRTGILVACLSIGLLFPVTNRAVSQSSQRSATYCDSVARNYAQESSRQGQVFGGAARGSLLGAGIGAIAGGAAAGAAIGATIGVIGGGARRNGTAERMYHAAYQDCMAGRRI